MAGKEKNLVAQAKRFGQPIPDRIKNKPILKTGLMLYYDAFDTLRFDTNESGYVPWNILIKYSERYEFSEVQTEMLIYLVRRLNECYSNWQSKKRGKG